MALDTGDGRILTHRKKDFTRIVSRRDECVALTDRNGLFPLSEETINTFLDLKQAINGHLKNQRLALL